MLFNHQSWSADDRRALIAKNSVAIENARLICIIMMSYVHLHFQGFPATGTELAIRSVVADVLGRSSVPLLSVVSGLLIVPFFARRTWLAGVRDRARSLILPMIAVNALAVILFGPPPGPVLEALLGIDGAPALIYMAFLRDLFVLCMLAPALIWLVRRAPLAMAVLGLAYYLADVATPIILRPQIAGFFLLGIFIALRGPIRLPTLPVLGAFVIILVIEVTLHPKVELYDLVVRRPVTAAAFWVIARSLRHMPRFGKAVFAFFLFHGIMFHVLEYSVSRQPVPIDYLTFWLVAPFACFAMLVFGLAIWRAIERRLPELGVFLPTPRGAAPERTARGSVR